MVQCTRCEGNGGWYETETCDTCGGVGKVRGAATHWDASGEPTDYKMVRCDKCNKKGTVRYWVKCRKCQGTGRD